MRVPQRETERHRQTDRQTDTHTHTHTHTHTYIYKFSRNKLFEIGIYYTSVDRIILV